MPTWMPIRMLIQHYPYNQAFLFQNHVSRVKLKQKQGMIPVTKSIRIQICMHACRHTLLSKLNCSPQFETDEYILFLKFFPGFVEKVIKQGLWEKDNYRIQS